ncbi:MAG: glycine--tRNA ligase subunit beta [Rhodospirillaceae bacterium TMED8]|nr:glycine--tRNA ligase subunit beta [Magnetovibrio sp.]OUT52338.1 MAG: glycine--tRNA ligase subunit beta [Rhodospirillaceae bacterium TMED8]|tara:strand:- start:1502 stop:3553 length:2052 start_codon:yes stop_codon:yes gene_type:complete
MPELLVEILSEEIPARMQTRAALDLKRIVSDALKDEELIFASADSFATPRRLALVIDGLPKKQPDVSSERRGPRTDAPGSALEGFLSSLPESATVNKRDTGKGEFFFATIDTSGCATAEVLAKVLPKALKEIPWPKSMRWGDSDTRWVRPVESVIAIFDGEIIDFKFASLAAGNNTCGHRFLSSGGIAVSNFADYRQRLLEGRVLLDASDRRAFIKKEAAKLAESENCSVKEDPLLLEEVAGLVEWPVVHIGTIDSDFMNVPKEVLITSMRSHQKYFSCLGKDGNLANRFIVVANTETVDNGKAVIAGNERVLRARLSDAKFFWDQDRRSSLATKMAALENRVFHAKLGNMDKKAVRIEELAVDISNYVNDADKDRVKSAARLAKADLSTGLVAEFPELQGIMGCHYALHDGESQQVADAIAEHYSPLGPNDICPSKPDSICVALADKIDSLIGFLAIDEKPTGSKDPFALRRAALGVIRLILENKLRLPLLLMFEKATIYYGFKINPSAHLLKFLADRLKVHLKVSGVRHDAIDAIFALGDEDDFVRLLARVHALSDFLVSVDGENLLIAYRRAANILKIEEKRDGQRFEGEIKEANLVQGEEKALHLGLKEGGSRMTIAISNEDYVGAMTALASLRVPVDSFFDKVTVNTDDVGLRENRLKLLNEIRSVLECVADFSKIEG